VDSGGPRKHMFNVFARWRQCARRHSAVSCAKTADPIDLPFGLWTRVGRRNDKFSHISQVAPMRPHERVHWRVLAHTIEPPVCCRDAALCQITLTTCSSFSASNYGCSDDVYWRGGASLYLSIKISHKSSAVAEISELLATIYMGRS